MTEPTRSQEEQILALCRRARQAARAMGTLSATVREEALLSMAAALRQARDGILSDNQVDLDAAREAGRDMAFLDRLRLTPDRVEKMARSLEEIALLPDPLGRTDCAWTRPNGLEIARVRVPLGVIAIIYESRPDVTSDATGMCVKTGNVLILRGGTESVRSNARIAGIIARAGSESGLPERFIQIVPFQDRAMMRFLLCQDEWIDLVVPRGGEGLIRAVSESSRIPVIKQYKGICHTYVHADADVEMAAEIAVNAKCDRPSTCNAMETLLVHRDIAESYLRMAGPRLREAGVTLRGCDETRRILDWAEPASEDDWKAEYLDLTLAVRVVADLDAALDHIGRYGSGHSEAIVTRSRDASRRFTREVDAAAVYVNASTRFTDGGQFGFGAELGVSTQKLHARGPVGLPELTTYKYVIQGDGHTRE